MPCSYYERPSTDLEIAAGKTQLLLEELRTGVHVSSHEYMHANLPGAKKKSVDASTATLCTALKAMSEKQLRLQSLEMQIWWRDHQIADAQREQQEERNQERRRRRKEVLDKLTDEEREILGL